MTVASLQVAPWAMERIKRRLDVLPMVVAPAARVRLLGQPAAEDIEGQLRLEGLRTLLAARGIQVAAWSASSQGTVALWLGGAAAVLPQPARQRVLLWPRPEDVPQALAALRAWQGQPPTLVLPDPRLLATAREAGVEYTTLLPDPAHALWGLLPHYPRGEGVLTLAAAGDWLDRLPPGRVGLLARSPEMARGLARRRLLAAARRLVAGYEALAAPRVLAGVFAALLGRALLLPPAVPGPAAYWAGWAAE